MAVGPEALELNQIEIDTVVGLEKNIDDDLKMSSVSAQGLVKITRRNLIGISDRIKGELVRRYIQAGWADVKVGVGGEWIFHSNK